MTWNDLKQTRAMKQSVKAISSSLFCIFAIDNVDGIPSLTVNWLVSLKYKIPEATFGGVL